MRSKQLLVTGILCFLTVFSLIFIQLNHTFGIKKITCTIDGVENCPDYLQAELNKDLGKSLFQVDIDAQLQKISRYQPSLHRYQFKQQLPDTIVVNFLPASELYAVKAATQENLYLVDETGTVINQTNQSTLPIIQIPDEMYQSLNLRSNLDPDIHQALSSMISQIETKHLQVQKISLINNDEIALELPDQKVAQLSVQGVAAQVDKLAYIVENINVKMVKQPIKTIDLRFKYPVLKT